ncbi:MAG: hypothetical protein K1W02_03230 [Muribaculaceae bacterium]
MEFIPLEPDENLEDLFNSVTRFPFTLEAFNCPGDFENENLVLKATENISSLYDYILTYIVEDMTTGLPDYAKCRFLTFDDIELEKGDFLQIYTRAGEDTTAIGFDTSKIYKVVYWGLPRPIWNVPHSSFELIKRGDSYSTGPSFS